MYKGVEQVPGSGPWISRVFAAKTNHFPWLKCQTPGLPGHCDSNNLNQSHAASSIVIGRSIIIILGTDLKNDALWCGGEPNNAANMEILLSIHGKDRCLNDLSTQLQRRYVCEQGLYFNYSLITDNFCHSPSCPFVFFPFLY